MSYVYVFSVLFCRATKRSVCLFCFTRLSVHLAVSLVSTGIVLGPQNTSSVQGPSKYGRR